jgi:hypothetical protein
MRIVLASLLVVTLGCHRAPALTHEEVAKLVAKRVHEKNLDAEVEVQGDELILHSKDGLGKFSLKTAYSLCAKSTATCEKYVDAITDVFDDTEEDEEEMGHKPGTASGRATSATPH